MMAARAGNRACEQEQVAVMKHHNRCSPVKTANGCHSVHDDQKIQAFPRNGILAENANLPLPILASKMQRVAGKAYSYVVSTVTLNHATNFEQTGSAPNFQGDVLTLCTCKHQMRSRLSIQEWEDDVWLAGFTSRTIHDGRHWLFFLAKVETAYESHSDLWNDVDAVYRREKAAHLHYLGDLFKPTTPKPTGHSRFSPSRYLMPSDHAHRQYPSDEGWKNDIHYWNASIRHPPLLVTGQRLTFLWEEPMIYFARKKHCRDYHKWASLQQLMVLL
jgi:hypothetical protein